VYYYHGDHLGSAQVVTDYRGDVYEHIEYTPYGDLWVEHAPNVEATPFRFTGKERDSETGLYYYGARYLNPQTSMWLSTDPAIGEYIPQAPLNDEARKYNGNLPGMGGVFNTVNLHVYHYAGNNPVRYTDPDGRKFIIAGGVFYRLRVRIDLKRIEKALIRSGDEVALMRFREIKNDPNYIVIITKEDPRTGKTTSRTSYFGQEYMKSNNLKENGIITYNFNEEGGPDTTGNSSRPAFIGLGHEVGHSIDDRMDPSAFRSRSIDTDDWINWYYNWPGSHRPPMPSFPNDAERFAVEEFENKLRWGYNKDPKFQRPTYMFDPD
jgi:RHS repeat-associated protein